MIFPIIVGALFMGILIYASNRLAEADVSIVGRAVLRLSLIGGIVGGALLVARFSLLEAVSCSPNCVGANLVGWDLEGAILRNSDFAEANLRNANLSGADLFNADFSGANLTGVNFQNANLRNARFIGASLMGADFRGAELADTDLRGAQLTDADLTQTDLTLVHLDGVVFDRAKLVKVDFRQRNLDGVSFIRADLTSANLSNSDLSGSQLSGANLSGAQLTGSVLAGAWLNLADLTGANLRDANLAGANLLGANLASANLGDSQLIGASLIGAHVNGTNLRGADLTSIRFLASELFPVDILTDPLLQELNELQLFDVIADVDFSGIRFNRETKWPTDRTSVLIDMLGQRFFDYMLPTDTSTDSVETALVFAGSGEAVSLSQAIYTRFVEDGNTQPIELDSLTSGAEIVAFCRNPRIHLIASNRQFRDNEIDLCAVNGRELITFTVALQAFVVVVNPNNDFVSNVTTEEAISLALANRWSDVNIAWPRASIQRLIPDLDVIVLEFWVEEFFEGDRVLAQRAIDSLEPVGNTAQLIQGVISNPYAIGMVDYAIYRQSASALKLLAINGQTPSPQSIRDNAYTLTQPLYLYADIQQIRELPELHNFLTYYLDHVNQIGERLALFPISPALLTESKAQLDSLTVDEGIR